MKYRQMPGCPYENLPQQNLPPWMRVVSATVLKSNTPTAVCTAAAGRHQRMQESATPSTMFQWCQYFCISLAKLKTTFEKGVAMTVLIKLLFDSGIPLAKLLPQGVRKKVRKGKTAETPAVPTGDRTPQNLTEEEVCYVCIDRASM